MKKINNLIIMERTCLYIIGLMILTLIGTSYSSNISATYVFLAMILIGTICIYYSYIYCLIHVCKNKELKDEKKVKNLLLILFLSIFYIPIYYTKYVTKEKQWYGIFNSIFFILMFIIVIILLTTLSLNV